MMPIPMPVNAHSGCAVRLPNRSDGIGNALRSAYAVHKVDLPADLSALIERLN